MNEYLKNVEKIEFAVTFACTGSCKHCSEGSHVGCSERIDPTVAADAVRSIASEYSIKTVMVFGGEPLLHMEAIEQIMRAALDMGVPRRQVITNGFPSISLSSLPAVAERIAACGVNDLLLSVDAFHQETIPLDAVREFARSLLVCSVPVRLSPAWLVSREDGNPYNEETRRILAALSDLNIPLGEGNVIFPEGNALKHLAEYFEGGAPENPYLQDPRDMRCVSVSPNGALLNGNLYSASAADILDGYSPEGI